MKETIIFFIGYILGLGMQDAAAQTYVIQNPQGQVTGYIQQNGNTVNVLTPQRQYGRSTIDGLPQPNRNTVRISYWRS
jgi:hypothetical protein